MNIKGDNREVIQLPSSEYGTYKKKKLLGEIKSEKDFLNKIILLAPELKLTESEKECLISLADELDNIRDRLELIMVIS
ncbi:MAG: hypothetical protein FGO69_09395 [Methanobacterium sp.]|mgnify:CR=1 FL=1|jgi:predicted transcriptional regulator|nr:MAG: hypothetical protein FGO69_09395 [Methanobacterium sp.]